MTSDYIVWLTPHAETSLTDITKYIAIDLEEAEIAIQYNGIVNITDEIAIKRGQEKALKKMQLQ